MLDTEYIVSGIANIFIGTCNLLRREMQKFVLVNRYGAEPRHFISLFAFVPVEVGRD